jgi:deoxycytidylate deaminase
MHTTTNHPWLTADRGWLPAGFLHLGEPVQRADGATATVVAIQIVPGSEEMWDLTVANVHTFAVGTGEYVVHNCGETGHVDYGSTDLSKAVQQRRISDTEQFGARVGKRGNYAAARLDDGSVITGRSGAIHAEQDLLSQADNMGRQVADLYSERAPCASTCAGALADRGINVSWTWEWNGANADATRAIRAATNQALSRAVVALFG